MDFAKLALETLKLAPRYLIALGIFSGFFLFCSKQYLERLGLFELAQQYRAWLGVTFVASLALFAVSVGSSLLTWLKIWWQHRREYKRITTRLRHLTEDEKQILRYYFAENTKANMLRVDDGVVQELVAERIIYRSASIGSVLEGFAHNISDIAWEYIHLYPSLLEGKTNTYRTDKYRAPW